MCSVDRDRMWKSIKRTCEEYGVEIMDATPECPAGIWIEMEDGSLVEYTLQMSFPDWFDENGELIGD